MSLMSAPKRWISSVERPAAGSSSSRNAGRSIGAGDLDALQFPVLEPVGPHLGQRFQPDRSQREHRPLPQRRLVAPTAREREQGFEEGRAPFGRAAERRLARLGLVVAEIRLSVVVLPEPFGPINPCTWPGRISRSSPSTARTPPKLSVMPRR